MDRPLTLTLEDASIGSLRAKLTRQEKTFAETYLRRGDVTDAVKAAYATGNASHQQIYKKGVALLHKKRVATYVAKLNEIAAECVGLESSLVLQEIINVAFSNPQDLIDANGNLLSPNHWPRAAAAAVSGIEQTQTSVGDVIKTTTKVKFWDKNAALDKLMRNLGLYAKDTKQVDHFLHSAESVGRTVEWVREFVGERSEDPSSEPGQDQPVLPALVHLQPEGHGQ